MMDVTQNNAGQGKDDGVFCMKRLYGEVCENPEFHSCIANGCRYLVFTRYGYIPLLEIIKEYHNKAKTGDKKAEAVLKKVMIPKYQAVINTIIREFHLGQPEKDAMKKLMGDIIDA